MRSILEAIPQGRVTAPLSDVWGKDKSDWKNAVEKGGYIDMVGSGHVKGNLVMKIEESCLYCFSNMKNKPLSVCTCITSNRLFSFLHCD